MSKVRQYLDTIQDVKNILLKSFGVKTGAYYTHIENSTHCTWFLYESGDLEFVDCCDMYSYEYAKILGETEEDVLLYVRDNRKTFYAVYSKRLQCKSIEAFEEWCEEEGVNY